MPTGRIAESLPGRGHGFFRRSTLVQQLLPKQRLMKGKLIGHVAFHAPFQKERFHSKQNLVQILSHWLDLLDAPYEACMTNATADESRAQRCDSACRRFCPSAVNS